MNWILILGLAEAILTTTSFVPQVIKTVSTKKTRDISLLMYIILITGVSFWLVYGLIIKDLPIIVANLVIFVLAMIVLIIKLKHG